MDTNKSGKTGGIERRHKTCTEKSIGEAVRLTERGAGSALKKKGKVERQRYLSHQERKNTKQDEKRQKQDADHNRKSK